MHDFVTIGTYLLASLYIERNTTGCEQMMKCMIERYRVIPRNRRSKLLIHVVLKAPPVLRTSAITFLISDSCLRNEDGSTNIQRYLPLWRSLFDTANGKDQVVAENCKLVFDDVIGYFTTVLECFLYEDCDFLKTKDKLSTILQLTSEIITLENARDYVTDYMPAILDLLVMCYNVFGLTVGLVGLIAELVEIADECCMFENGDLNDILNVNLKDFYKSLQIHRCEEEALLCACCLSLIQAPKVLYHDYENILYSLEIIFSRNDVEPNLLIKSLKKFENFLQEPAFKSNKISLNIISQIEKLKFRSDLIGKDARILQRDVVLFLGSYSDLTLAHYNTKLNTEINVLALSLKEGLCLSIPNLNERKDIKLNLYKVLDLALQKEDPVVLDSMLLVLSAELSTKQNPELQKALTAVIVSLSFCHSRGDSVTVDRLQAAVKLCARCDCVKDFVYHIAASKSPGVRKILSNLLEVVITLEPHSDQTEAALATLFDELEVMFSSDNANHRIAALDMTETTLAGLNENTDFTKKYLQTFIKNIAKTNEHNTAQAFKITSEFFINKMALVSESLDEFSKDFFCATLNSNYENIYLNMMIKYCLLVLNRCFEVLNKDCIDFDGFKFEVTTDFSKNIKSIIFLTEAKDVFDLNREQSILLIFSGNSSLDILEKIINFDCNDLKLEEFCKEIVFRFLEKYAEVLLEVKYQDTISLLSNALFKTKPATLNKITKKIRNCINECKKYWKSTPQIILTAFENWCQKIPLESITMNIQKSEFTYEDSVQICALKNIITIIQPKTVIKNTDLIKKWTRILQRLHSRNYVDEFLKSKMAYLKNILAVSIYFFNRNEGKELVSDSQNGVNFCTYFISVFAKYFLSNDVLLETDAKVSFAILNNTIIFYGRNKCDADICGKIMDLLEKLWQKLEAACDFNQQHTLLLNINKLDCLNVNKVTPFAIWCLNKMAATECVDKKVQLMQVIGVFLRDYDYKDFTEYKDAMTSFSRILPTKWSSRDDRTPTLTLYKTLSICADRSMLRMALTTVAGDEIPSEIEASLQECMRTLGSTQDVGFLHDVYKQCDDFELRVHLYDRVLVPLLSNSPQSILEQFFAAILPDVIKTLWKKSSSNFQIIHMEKCGRGFHLAKLAFVLLPISTLESNSFAHLDLKNSRSLSAALSKVCATLRTTLQCNSDANDEFKKIYRYFQTSNWNCFAAILLRKSPANFTYYKVLLQQDVWPLIVDSERTYRIYIEPLGRSRLKRHLSTRTESSDYISAFTASSSRSVFTRTRILSDNPFLYDFIQDGGGDSVSLQNEEIILMDNELNSHPCASVLSSVIKHLYVNPTNNHSKETTELIDGVLKSDLHCNVKWLLSQIIVNCKEDLKSNSTDLTPSLINVIATTPYESGGFKLLNGLHINILNTITEWHKQTPFSQATDETKENVNSIVTFLIHTALYHRRRLSVFKAVLNTLDGVCCVFKDFAIIRIDWGIFDSYLKDTSNEIPCLEVLLKITANKIDIPELMTVLVEKFHSKHIFANRLSNASKLLGQALANTPPPRKAQALSTLWRLLEASRRADIQSYVTILFYCQQAEPRVCNEQQFRYITDLTNKMLREQKSKCFHILATYIKQSRETNEYIAAMFETIDFNESIYGDFSCNAMEVVKCGFTLMDETLKRRIVFLVSEFCTNAVVNVRAVAYEIMVAAFREKINTPTAEPTAKRQKTQYPTTILNILNETDFYLQAIGSRLGVGLTDDSTDISETLLRDVGAMLCDSDFTVRFCEAIFIAIYLPTTLDKNSTTKSDHKSNAPKCLAAILNLLFMGVTSQDGFQTVLLRNEPLQVIGDTANQLSSKLLTLSHTYQGTFRRTQLTTSRGQKRKTNTDASTGLNVQIPLKNILDTILKFSGTDEETSITIFIETIKVLQNYQSSSTFNMSECLASILVGSLTRQSISQTVNDVSPCVLMACRRVLDQCCALDEFRPTLEYFLEQTKMSEGEILCRFVYEEMLLREKSTNQFVLGINSTENEDEVMRKFSQQFTLKDISTIFGKLSNWDDLSTKQRRQLSSNLPTLWTDHAAFSAALVNYEDGPIWLARMCSALCDEDDSAYLQANCLREVDRWPRRLFHVSAVTESIKWRHIMVVEDLARLPNAVRNEDCFAEWAVRLMARAQYIQKLTTQESCDAITTEALLKQSRGHELVWCERVNDSHLADSVLHCVKRNISTDLHDSETLGWLLQHALALRHIGLRNRNVDTLKKALGKIETYTKDYIEQSTIDVATSVRKLQLILYKDLNSLSEDKINTVIQEITNRNYLTDADETLHSTALNNIISSYEICLCYYDGLWSDLETKRKINFLTKMVDIVIQLTNISKTRNIDSYVCMLINRIIVDCNGIVLSEEFCEKFGKILEKTSKKQKEILAPLTETLNNIIPSAHLRGLKREDIGVRQSRQCLQLVCDPNYVLLKYLELLGDALLKDDETKWTSTFNSISELFSNPMAGTAFQSLNNYIDSLRQLRIYESTQEFKEKSRQILKVIHKNLDRLGTKSTLNLQSLCPSLTSLSVGKCEGDGNSLSRLLLGDTGVRVLKFYKEVKVYTNSIRRPCVLKAVLSTGHTRRFLIKRGEPLRVDAALSHIFDQANTFCDHKARSNDVTPLSEDCALIQYLDNHVTLRSLLPGHYNLNEMVVSMQANESQAITASRSSTLELFEKLCEKVPAYALRNAIETDSISFQEFVLKKANFLNSLAAMTVFHWIFGLGDRHTENLLYSSLDGAVCGIDFANVFSFGVNAGVPELPPARCTRNMVAVCDRQVLESRIQKTLTSLREAAPLLIPSIRVNFMWQSQFYTADYQNKLKHTEDLLKGTKLPYQVTSEVLLDSKVTHKEAYVKLLNEIFGDVQQEEVYDVETQVSGLLRQCTDQRILSVTRSGWEPWL